MPTQHRLIPDAELHETKGIASATVGTVQVATGAGAGTWKKLGSDSISGVSGDAGVANKVLVSNGTNGFLFKDGFAYGSMGLIGNTNAFTVATATDATLATNADYALFTGTGAPLAAGTSFNVNFSTNSVSPTVTGVYKLVVSGQITSFPTTTARVGLKYRINGATYSSRKSLAKSFNAGDLGQFNMNEIVALTAADTVQIYVASSAAGGLIISDLSVTLELVRAT